MFPHPSLVSKLNYILNQVKLLGRPQRQPHEKHIAVVKPQSCGSMDQCNQLSRVQIGISALNAVKRTKFLQLY